MGNELFPVLKGFWEFFFFFFFAALGTTANLLIMHWRTAMDQTVPEQWGLEYTWGHRTEAAKMTLKEILIFISVIKPGIRACGSWEQPGDALPRAM